MQVELVDIKTLVPDPSNARTHNRRNLAGSMLIACERLGRKCVGLEISEQYCSVIIERWQKFTGKEARKADR